MCPSAGPPTSTTTGEWATYAAATPVSRLVAPGPLVTRHAGRVGDASKAVRHERGGLLVVHVDVLHALVVVERIEHVEERRAHDAEHVRDALGLQELDDRTARVELGHHFA